MPEYLDPRNDFIFDRIFWDNDDLLISFLNSLLPFEQGREITGLEYIRLFDRETPFKCDSIFYTRCRDNLGQEFIVAIQLYWLEYFYSRMVFDGSKAYVRQFADDRPYDTSIPIYGLGIMNDTVLPETDKFYHHYKLYNRDDNNNIMKDTEFVLIELKKTLNPERLSELKNREMAILWLRFLTETGPKKQISKDLTKNSKIAEALKICESDNYTKNEMYYYESAWDKVSTVKTLITDLENEKLIKILHHYNYSISKMAKTTGLSTYEVKEFLKFLNLSVI